MCAVCVCTMTSVCCLCVYYDCSVCCLCVYCDCNVCCLYELRAWRWADFALCAVCVCVKGMEMGSDSEFVDVEGESFEDYQPRAGRKRRISQVKQPAFFI